MNALVPTIQIVVNDREFNKLQGDVWSEDFVRGQIVGHGVSEPIKIRYRGGHTREYPKKSFEIHKSNGGYHLNAEYDDPSMIRNALSFRFFEWIQVPSPKTQHCSVILNGKNLGLYLQIEAVHYRFFERRRIQFSSLLYAGNDDANFSLINSDSLKLKTSLFDGYELIIGDSATKKRLEQFIFSLNTLQGSKLHSYLQEHIDIDNYLRWIAGAVCTSNYDGFHQNYAMYEYGKPAGPYRFIPWDYEGTWGRNCFGKLFDHKKVPITGHNSLTKKLLSSKSNVKLYREILSDILETSFTTERCKWEMERLMGAIRSNIYVDASRKYSQNDFDGEAEVILTYVDQRRSFISQSLKSLHSL